MDPGLNPEWLVVIIHDRPCLGIKTSDKISYTGSMHTLLTAAQIVQERKVLSGLAPVQVFRDTLFVSS